MIRSAWYPIAASRDLVPRHVFEARLFGQEMAAWRADDGHANLWENRCLHRGLRLTIGVNTGTELKCRYHGWRYANRTGSCTYIPAHPADAPARTVCTRSYPVIEQLGLIWTTLDPAMPLPDLPRSAEPQVFRAMHFNASAAMVRNALAQPRFDFTPGCIWVNRSDHPVSQIAYDSAEGTLALILQPADTRKTVLHVLFFGNGNEQLAWEINQQLSVLRREVEARAAEIPAEPPFEPVYSRVTDALAEMPERGTSSGLRVRIAAKTRQSPDVVALELAPLFGELPTVQPGGHIDLHLPNGLVRQYSLTNGPGEAGNWVIGVKREEQSRGGSQFIHDNLQTGDVVLVSGPHNNFTLRRDALHTIFLAGGIGLTPLLAMAKTLALQNLSFEFHYFVRDSIHVTFPEQIAKLGPSAQIHAGLSPSETAGMIGAILHQPGHARHCYICGPGPMLEAAREAARFKGWPDSAVHFEYFRNSNALSTDSEFDIALARSGLTLRVAAGETILDVLHRNGVAVDSSCQQGACGSCRIALIEGEADHQDVCLTDSEKRANTAIMACVSRAKSGRLVLDI